MKERIIVKLRKLLFISMVVITLLIGTSSIAEAVPQLPSSFYGTVKVNGANVPDGTVVSAWINGVEYASMLSETFETDSVFFLDVPGDDPSTTEIIEGGVTGDTIIFKIDGLEANETASWNTGTNVNLDLTQVNVTVTANPQTKVYGDEDPELTFTYEPNDPPITFTGSLDREPGEDVDTYAITPGDLAAEGYNIDFVSADFEITPKAITVTADPQSKVYGEADPTLSYHFTPDLVGGDSFSGELERDAGEDVGSYEISQGSLALSSNYTLSYTDDDLTITVRPIVVTADDKSKVVSQPDPDLTYTIASGSLIFPDAFTGEIERETGEAIGTYAIEQGTLALNANYDLTFYTGTFTIEDYTTITVTADSGQTKVYGDADPELTYTYDPSEPTVNFTGSLSREAGEDVDTYAITKGTLAAVGYNIDFVSTDFDITPKAIDVTAYPQSKVYGETDPELSYHFSPDLVGGDSFSGELEREAGESVGSYEISQGTLALDDNYTLSYTDDDLTITTRPIQVMADDKSKEIGQPDPALTYTIASGSLVFSDAFTGAIEREPGETIGTYAIEQGSLMLSANYDLTFIDGTFTITDLPTITVTADSGQTKVYGGSDPIFSYTYEPDNPSITFTGSLSRIPGEDAGSYAITKGTLAAVGYNIDFVSAAFEITPKPITVTAGAKSMTYGDIDPVLTYQVTGTLEGSDSFTGSLSRIPGQDVGSYTILRGTLGIDDGNSGANYDLTFVTANLTVNARLITITADDKEKVFGGTDPAFTYQITSGALAYSDTITGDLVREVGEDLGTYAILQGNLAISDGNGGNNYTLTFINGVFTITDEPKDCYPLTLSFTGYGLGLIADPPNSDGCDVGMYEEGESVSLLATPDEDWHVDSWEGSADDGSKGEENSIIMPGSAAEVIVNYMVYTFVPILTGGK
jgi:hypothetical protein